MPVTRSLPRPRVRPRGSLLVLTATTLAATFLGPAGTASAAGTHGDAGRPVAAGAADRAASGVSSVEYHLGERAFTVPNTGGARAELTGVVHYPTDLGTGPRPVVVILHGLWWSCADQAAWTAGQKAQQAGDEQEADKQLHFLSQWPCRPGAGAMESYRGFDYLGEQLARQGFVTISISADGLNAVDPSGADGDAARTALINAHLAMWARLAATGTGPLAGHFTRTGTGQAVSVDFRGRLDMTDVGTLGHSRGGRAVQWQASNANRGDWPQGVAIRAVLPLAAVDPAIDGTPEQSLTAPDIPFISTFGTCDRGGFSSTKEGDVYYTEAGARPERSATIRTLHLIGGNHNFFNTRWSPSSGLPAAADDAEHDGPAGTCVSDADGTTDIPQLTETAERRALATYATAFFQRYLNDDRSSDRVLNGTVRPLGPAIPVEIATTRPSGR
ncbi:alpha/beta hydrolase [Actinacidiphila acidipaludis]|uniref:Alpha/beta hydrolase n=1 Tax=Actinacidiphila acidipaludis TaxID=2873382 RepID=A0ABS7QGZ1_9ACTN|nr:alpha/beta hydrolase [Streptomyces acidipaludis]MBY8882444.1 alpha/beta hydrolase [Streptomyces acidipaludis]